MTVPKLLTATEVADVLGLHPKVVARHTRQGRYQDFAINIAPDGGRPAWRYDPRRLEKWLEQRRLSS